MRNQIFLILIIIFIFSPFFMVAQTPVELPVKYLGGDATLGYPEIINGSGMYGGTFRRFHTAYDRKGHVLVLYVDNYNQDINNLVCYNEDMSKKYEYDINDILIQSTGQSMQIINMHSLSNKIFLVTGNGMAKNKLLEFSSTGKIIQIFLIGNIYNPILDMDEYHENDSINLYTNNNIVFDNWYKNKKFHYDVIDLNKNTKQVKNDFLEYLDPNQVYTGIKSIDDNIYNYLKSQKIFWIPGGNDDWIGQANVLYYYVFPLVDLYNQDYNKYRSFANAFPIEELRQKNSVFFDAKKNIYIFSHSPSGFLFGVFDEKGKMLGKYVSFWQNNQQEILQELAVNPNGNITFYTKGKVTIPGQDKNNYHFYLVENTWDPMDIKELQKQGYYLDPLTNSSSTMICFSSLSSSGYPTEQFDKNAYHPARAFDGNPLTSWIEDKPGFGDGSSISASCNPSVNIDEIRISGGYFDAQWWPANNRIKKAIVTINGKDYAMDFSDKMVPQSMKLPAEVLLTDFKLTIKDAYLAVGQTWNDTAISEIEFYYKGKKVEIDLGDYSQYLKVVPISSAPKQATTTVSMVHHIMPDNMKVG